MLRKIILLVSLIFGFSITANAQTPTTVNATVRDPNGIPYANGSVTAQLIPGGITNPTVNGQPISGFNGPAAIDANGHFSMDLFCNTAGGGCSPISPSGTQWLFTISNPGVQPPSGFGTLTFAVPITITGTTQDVSAALSAAAPLLFYYGLTGLIDAGSPAFGGVSPFRSFNDGATTATQNTLTSATLNCSTTDNGKLVIVINPSTHVYPFGTGAVKQTGCTSSTVATLSTTASVSGSSLNWAIGAEAGIAFQNAAAVGWTTGKGVSLPCGGYIVGSTGVRPFVFNNPQTYVQNYYLQGCQGANNRTTILLHPQISSSILSTGGNLFYGPNQSVSGIVAAGINGQSGVKSITLTTQGGAIPGTGGQGYALIGNFGFAEDIMVNMYGMTNGSCSGFAPQAGEVRMRLINFQNSDSGYGSSCSMVTLDGQGSNVVEHSICALLNNGCIFLNGPVQVELLDDYFSQVGGSAAGAVNTTLGGGNVLNIRGGFLSGQTVNPLINDTTGATINISGGAVLVANSANQPVVGTVSGTKLSVDQANLASATAGFAVRGTGGTFYDQHSTNTGIGPNINLVADGHSIVATCTGTATSNTVLGLYGTGPNITATPCTSATIGAGIPVNGARTLQNLVVTATNGGVLGSSGTFVVLRNGGATGITCTIGTGLTCADGTHTVTLSNGDLITIEFSTQPAETLAGITATLEWN